MNQEWMKNKIRGNDGCYYYCCKYNNCRKPRVIHKPGDINYNSSIYSDYCIQHYKKMDMMNTIIID